MKGAGGIMFLEPSPPLHRPKLGAIFHSEPPSLHKTATNADDSDDEQQRPSNATTLSPQYLGENFNCNNYSPYLMSPLNYNDPTVSPLNKSPWLLPVGLNRDEGHVGSLIREKGHVYSLAVSGNLLYTGSDSNNIRVWKDLKDYTGFKSGSGFVKAIVISGEKIFSGHQDGKIRIWKVSNKVHKRIGTLPRFKDCVKTSLKLKPENRVRIKHSDAVSCLSLDEENGLLYSGSWDKTVKVWSVRDSKCLESIEAHSDAVNAVAVGFGVFVFTGSADGTVKMWRREIEKKKTKHVLERVLLEQESAVTALAVNQLSTVVYCGSSDGAVNFWERGEKNGVTHGGVLRGHKSAVLCLAVVGNLVLSGSADKNVCVWKREENGVHTWVSVLSGHTGPVKCIAAVEEDGGCCEKGDQRCMVYTGSVDRSVKVWRVCINAPSLSFYSKK